MKYAKSLSEAATTLQLPYNQIYRHKHAPEFQKTSKGYNVDRIGQYIAEYDARREEEAKAESLIQSEDELIEKQIKLETAKHKCKLLELEIKKKEGILVDVNLVLETRTKEYSLLRKNLTEMVQKLPIEIAEKDEETCRIRLNEAINNVLSELSEFITDDWEDVSEAQETDIEEEL